MSGNEDRPIVFIDFDVDEWKMNPNQAEMDSGDMRATGDVILYFKDHDAVFALMKKLIDRMIETDAPDVVVGAVVDVYHTASDRWIVGSCPVCDVPWHQHAESPCVNGEKWYEAMRARSEGASA